MLTALAAASLFMTPASLPEVSAQVPPRSTGMRGAPGLCIRWDQRRTSRVAEAIIVRPSGNARLDEMLPERVKQMDWPLEEPDYRGQWIGIWMAIGGAETPSEPVPDCSALEDYSWAPPPAAAPTAPAS